jgi:hypothetical protein
VYGARLGDLYLHTERIADEDGYTLFNPKERNANIDFILSVSFLTTYYCVFRHQKREFHAIGQKVKCSGFQDGSGRVERFNITQAADISDPEKRQKAKEQLPLI